MHCPGQADSRLYLQPRLSSDDRAITALPHNPVPLETLVPKLRLGIALFRNSVSIHFTQLATTSARGTNLLSCSSTRLRPAHSRYHSTAEPLTISSASRRKLRATKTATGYSVAWRASSAAAPASVA